MPIFPKLFSKRTSKKRVKDPLTYQIKRELRIQIYHALEYASPHKVNSFFSPTISKAWKQARKEVGAERAVIQIGNQLEDDFIALANYLIRDETSTPHALDALEIIIFQLAMSIGGYGLEQTVFDEIVLEINDRFREAGVGYEWIRGSFVKEDTRLDHQEVVIPGLESMSSDSRFQVATQEMHKALLFYRNGDFVQVHLEAAKALESTIKVICEMKNIPYNKDRDTLSVLTKKLVDEGLISHSVSMAIIEAPGRVRNRDGAHGGGEHPHLQSQPMAGWSLRSALTHIRLLIEVARG